MSRELIERLRQAQEIFCENGEDDPAYTTGELFRDAADALASLPAAVTGGEPVELVRLVERLETRNAFYLNGGAWVESTTPDTDCRDAAFALTALQGELEPLRADCQAHYELLRECQAEFRAVLGPKAGIVETIETHFVRRSASPLAPAQLDEATVERCAQVAEPVDGTQALLLL